MADLVKLFFQSFSEIWASRTIFTKNGAGSLQFRRRDKNNFTKSARMKPYIFYENLSD